jgi:hypothetical protein
VRSPSSQPKEGPFTAATAGKNGDIEEARELVIKPEFWALASLSSGYRQNSFHFIIFTARKRNAAAETPKCLPTQF